MLIRSRKFVAIGLALALSGTVACGEDDGAGPAPEVHELEIIDRSDDEVIGEYHDDHWHGVLVLDAHEDEHTSVGFRFYDHDDEPVDVPLGTDEYSYGIDVEDEDLVWYDTHSDHFHVRGEEVGDTRMNFSFTHDDEVFFETTEGISVAVVDDHDDDDNDHHHDDELEIADFALLDRNDGEARIAEVHGDHWDGDFSDGIELDVAADPDNYDTAAAGQGEAVSLGADVEEGHDDHTHHVSLDGNPYELNADFAHSGDDDYVDLDAHGDHVHVIGVAEGHAHVVFQIVDTEDDDIVWESPEFEFDVH